MSELHSETYDQTLDLTVRVKLVDLNHLGHPSRPSNGFSTERASRERLAALAGPSTEKLPRPCAPGQQNKSAAYRTVEVCMLNGQRVPAEDYETHIEGCSICANRVELQLDFIDTLEVALYQKRRTTNSKRMNGAMLVSAPKLNFAVCGELEIS